MDVDGTRVVTSRLDVNDRNLMLQVGDRVRDKLQSGVIALGGAIDGQPALIVMVTKDQTERGLHAGRIIQEIAPMVGGRGGGRPELAQGGGSSVEHLDAALAAVPNIVKSQVAG